jgi:drug/metabolite transporter (DMT)-like permease
MPTEKKEYCWTALIIVVFVGLILTIGGWYIKKALNLDSSSSVIAMGMMYITTLLLIKSLPFMTARQTNRGVEPPHCYNNPGMDWLSLLVMFGMLMFCKVVLRHSSTYSLGQNMHIDTTVLLMMLGYILLFIISPPMQDGTRGPIMPWFQKHVNRYKEEIRTNN